MADSRKQQQDALFAARLAGCVCDPYVIYRESSADDFPEYEIQHDDWCPMTGHSSQLIIRLPDPRDN